MNFNLDPDYLTIQQQARKFAQSIEHLAAEADECSEVHPEVLAALRSSGLTALMVPSQYGGYSERLDPLAICLVREVLILLCHEQMQLNQ
jgi:acyl-CoA dehydrogenase